MKTSLIIILVLSITINKILKPPDIGNKMEIELIDYSSLPILSDTNVFCRDSVYSYMVRIGMRYPDVVYRQALLECGFSSDLFKNANNLFGMRMPGVRKTTAIGKYKGYAKFSSWKESINDYKLYQDAYLSKAKTKEEYYRLLDKNYGATGNYSRTLKKMSDEVIEKNK